jgi:hypothetical protein
MDMLLYYQGQNTGGDTQQLIYGNKILYDCYKNESCRIFYFMDLVYKGEYTFAMPPFQEDGKWYFPLKKK